MLRCHEDIILLLETMFNNHGYYCQRLCLHYTGSHRYCIYIYISPGAAGKNYTVICFTCILPGAARKSCVYIFHALYQEQKYFVCQGSQFPVSSRSDPRFSYILVMYQYDTFVFRIASRNREKLLRHLLKQQPLCNTWAEWRGVLYRQ